MLLFPSVEGVDVAKYVPPHEENGNKDSSTDEPFLAILCLLRNLHGVF